MQNMVMDGNCAKPMQAQNHHEQHADDLQAYDQQTPDHSDACYHCDQPAQLSNASHTSVVSATLVLSDVVSLPTAPLLNNEATSGLLSARTPTGPPRSSSLLYTTSQRILI